jgi:hypothetical protein
MVLECVGETRGGAIGLLKSCTGVKGWTTGVGEGKLGITSGDAEALFTSQIITENYKLWRT